MKPEKHTIRQLEKQLEGASPEVARSVEYVIQGLKTCLMNSNKPAALAAAQKQLAADVAALKRIMKSKK